MQASQPFILTAELPDDIFQWADALRKNHFPPERNWLKAHVTLFHALAPSLREELRDKVSRIASIQAAPAAKISGLLNLGRGTALAIESPGMLAIRQDIAEHFHGCLTAQDQHKPRLHITIQNKVESAAARALQNCLGPEIKPRDFRFKGLGLHLYCGPHWQSLDRWSFRGKEGG